MEVIKKEITHTIDVYKAYDGHEFEIKEECQKYEKTALCLLRSKYNKLVIKRVTETSLFNCGSEDYEYELVSINSANDIEVIMKYMCLLLPNMTRKENEENYNKTINKLEEALKRKHNILIYRGYDNDNFYIEDNIQEKIENFAKRCGYNINLTLNNINE